MASAKAYSAGIVVHLGGAITLGLGISDRELPAARLGSSCFDTSRRFASSATVFVASSYPTLTVNYPFGFRRQGIVCA